MLPKERGGVVDSHLRVYVQASNESHEDKTIANVLPRYGTKGLRVCDVSIFGRLPDVNLVGPVFAVAELGAEIIRREYNDL